MSRLFTTSPWWPLILILLLASYLRWYGLGMMESMLLYDEAYNLWDVLQLLDTPRLTPFLPNNFGRESGWHYFLMPFVLTLGVRPFAVHFAASVVGIMTVAAVYRLGKELFGAEVGIWSALALAVLYPHVHLSHIGLRAITYPLIGTFAITMLHYAWRKKSRRSWLIGGVWLGLLMYTYFAARAWIFYIGAWLIVVWLLGKKQRVNIFLALLTATLVAMPQIMYAWLFPALSFGRIDTVATLSPEMLVNNTLAWLGAWLVAGDANAGNNLPHRPILDPVLALISLFGLLAWFLRPNVKTAVWVFGLGIVSLLPSLLSDFPPNHLRAIGFVVPLALLLGTGMEAYHRFFAVRFPAVKRYALLIGISGFIFSGGQSYTDFNTWLTEGRVESSVEMYINESVLWLEAQKGEADNRPIYFTPFSPYHPNIAILRYRMAPQVVGGFVADNCLVVNDAPSLLVNVPAFQPGVVEKFSGWAELERLHQAEQLLNGKPLYEVFALTANNHLDLSLPAESPVFGEGLQVQFSPVPTTAVAGETINIDLAFRAHEPQAKVYSAFIHLHGDPSPYAGGTMWANTSEWLCQSYPSPEWQADELIIQTLALQLPPDIPSGSYEVVMGLFESPNGDRLILTAPYRQEQNYFVLGDVWVQNNNE